MKSNRRSFIFKASAGTVALTGIPGLANAAGQGKKKGFDILSDVKTILFQGDSITDAGRDKNNQDANRVGSFGRGYAFLLASWLLNKFPGNDLVIYNRGISGNKVYQLAERWQEDCLDLKPGLLSILIGVNDYWHMHDGRYDGILQKYEDDYRQLLIRTNESLPGIKLVICEPFALKGGTAVDESWFPAFDGYRKAAMKMAVEFEAIFVPFQDVFDEAQQAAPAGYWSPDGVHPSMAGCQRMATAWIKAIKKDT